MYIIKLLFCNNNVSIVIKMFFSHNFVAHIRPRSRNLRKKFSKGTHVNSKTSFLGNFSAAIDHKYLENFF